MRLRQYKKGLRTAALLLLAAIALPSCDDFLTITPSNSIPEEEFWEDKSDLEGVVTACYARLIKSDVMSRFITWGELRSDNFELTTGVTNENVRNIMNANLLSTNGIFDWTCFYNCINYCNKVLDHGEEVVARDESFSEGDWRPIRAEMIALRAFCHFYLVRTFGEVPYVTTNYDNDGQDFSIEQSTQIEVLDNIISDLESVKGEAMVDYGNTVDNKGKITRKAVYAMLADVYLWRASLKAGNSTIGGTSAESDYQSCIDCCDWVMEQMLADYKKDQKNQSISGSDDLELEDLLIPNVDSSTSLFGSSVTGAFDNIFGTGNSRESIFELQIDGTNNSNDMVNTWFYNLKEQKTGTLVCANSLMQSVDANPNQELPGSMFTKTDYRRWETAQAKSSDQTEYPLAKYIYRTMEQYNGTSTSGMKDNTDFNTIVVSVSTSYPNPSNWIVYRLSDMMLMKAEAISQLYSDEDNLKEAFQLVRSIFKRSNPYAYENKPASTDSLSFESFNSQEAMENLVMAERQREFVGEGKRWFDLVRYAQRHGGTSEMLDMLTRKYGDNKKAIEAKLASLQSLFSPIYTDELKNNPLLHQNEVWNDSESTSKTDEL